jgi:hypothetical protein
MDHKPRRKNDDDLRLAWNYQHVCQLYSYSCKYQGWIPGHWDFFPTKEISLLMRSFYPPPDQLQPQTLQHRAAATETLNMMYLQDQTLQEFIFPKQVLPKEHMSKQILPQECSWLLNLSVLFLKANASRNKRCIAILTDKPVKAAFRDRQKLRQVTKGKRISEAKQEAPFDNSERDSKKRRKIVRKIQTDCSDKNGAEIFCLVCVYRYSTSVAGEIWVQHTQCQMQAHEK